MLIPLKLKYRAAKSSHGGKSTFRTSEGTRKTGLAALMENERARELHFLECASRGWWEQIPTGLRERYKKKVSAS